MLRVSFSDGLKAAQYLFVNDAFKIRGH